MIFILRPDQSPPQKPYGVYEEGTVTHQNDGPVNYELKMHTELLSVAPMMDWTDRHYRFLMRGITRCATLYTEMIVDTTVLHQSLNLDFFIGKDISEHPSVIQIGGHDADTVASAAHIVGQYGDYSEINLNCGCPSPRVSRRCFGARLMLEPELVREIVSKTSRVVSQPVTVKCRIGVDTKDSYEELCKFIQTVHQGGTICLIYI